MPAAEWGRRFGPFDDGGEPIPLEELPITKALRQGRPGHARFTIRSVDGAEHEIEGSAFPIVADDGPGGRDGLLLARETVRVAE